MYVLRMNLSVKRALSETKTSLWVFLHERLNHSQEGAGAWLCYSASEMFPYVIKRQIWGGYCMHLMTPSRF